MKKACYLVGIVGTGDQQEDPGEGVLGWIGDLPGLRAWMKRRAYKYTGMFTSHYTERLNVRSCFTGFK